MQDPDNKIKKKRAGFNHQFVRDASLGGMSCLMALGLLWGQGVALGTVGGSGTATAAAPSAAHAEKLRPERSILGWK